MLPSDEITTPVAPASIKHRVVKTVNNETVVTTIPMMHDVNRPHSSFEEVKLAGRFATQRWPRWSFQGSFVSEFFDHLSPLSTAVDVELSSRDERPIRPSQILGVVLEEAFCDLLMMHPPMVDSHAALQDWASSQLETIAQDAHAKGKVSWEAALWKTEEDTWDDVRLEDMRQRLSDGLRLYLEEVKACFEAQGGPFLEEMWNGNDPFHVPSPSLGGTHNFRFLTRCPMSKNAPGLRSIRFVAEERGSCRLERGLGMCSSLVQRSSHPSAPAPLPSRWLGFR